MRKCLTFLIALIFIFIPAFAEEITSCGYTINSPGTYYVVQDLYAIPNIACIHINASNVVLDCQNYMIYGDGIGYGIITISDTAPGYQENVEIRNCRIKNYYASITVKGKNIKISNVQIDGNNIDGSIGIAVAYGSHSATIEKSIIIKTRTGVSAVSTSIVFIRDSAITNNIRGVYLSGISYAGVYKNVFNNNIDLLIDQVYGSVSGITYDNKFYGGGVSISGSHAMQFFNHPPSQIHTCGSNIMGGCAIGGNFWKTYSHNCINNDRDSFCDYAYQIPGTNYVDLYPLAEPQPFMCANLETHSVYMSPTDTKTINWNIWWNYLINPPQFIVVSMPEKFSLGFNYNCNFNTLDGTCTVKVEISTMGASLGDYTIEVQVSSGNCWYRETITVHVVPQACSGSVELTLSPSSVNPGGSFSAVVSGLSNCGGVAYIKDYRGCVNGETLAFCQVSGSGCSVNLNAPTNVGTYRYYACFDINLDGAYTSGEYDWADLNVVSGPIPACMTISQPGTYTINYDIIGDGPCIVIFGNDIVFDCLGHSIYGRGNGPGIFVKGNNIEIKNCKIEGFYTGVFVSSSSDVKIRNNYINSTDDALSIFHSHDIEIESNELYARFTNILHNSSSIIFRGNEIAGQVAFSIGRDVYGMEITKNFVRSRISKLLTGYTMENLFYVGNGSLVDIIFYDNVVEKTPKIADSLDGVKPNVKLNIYPTDGISITYNMKIGGNYWWDYAHTDKCKDENFDNFCDKPYEPQAGFVDEYPLSELTTFYACPEDIINMGYFIRSTELNKPGEYRIGTDIETNSSSCFTIFVEPSPPYSWFTGAGHVNNVVIDCLGHKIKYNGAGTVFYVLSSTNFTLKNCKIEVGPDAKRAILYATYTNTFEIPWIKLINNEIVSYSPVLVATAPPECPLPEAPKEIEPGARNDKVGVFLYNNKITTSSTALKLYCSVGEITKNNITADKCMQIGNPGYFSGFGVKPVKVYDNMFLCDVNQPIVIDSNYLDTEYAWNVEPKAGLNILGGGRIGGNFWYNYSLKCNDTNYDGFCDEPFVINEKNKDLYPLSWYILSISVPPIPSYPMLTPASIFFVLSLGLSAGLEYVARKFGSTSFGVIFGASFITMMLIGAIANIIPGWMLIVFVIISAFMFAYIVVKLIGG